MKNLSLSTIIKLFVAVGLLTVFAVIVQSCSGPKKQNSKEQIDLVEKFATASLKKLQVKDVPPVQPRNIFKTADGQEMSLYDYRASEQKIDQPLILFKH